MLEELKAEMKRAAKDLEFERAATEEALRKSAIVMPFV